MLDVYTDLTQQSAVFGTHIELLEMCELHALREAVTKRQVAGKLKDFNALNFSLNYLPNLGKKDAKAFTILVLSVNNILGQKNIYGYRFSDDGLRSQPVLPSANTFVFIGCFINFGIDRTQDAINNNL